jgi:hypothetical protein
MQPNNQNNRPARTQSLIITAITLFALSGLIIGFATGAVTRPTQAAKPTTVSTTTNTMVQPTKPSPTSVAKPVPLGCPSIDQTDSSGVADGTTIHTFQMHVVGTTNPKSCKANTDRIQSPGITCKLWLSKIPNNQLIEIPGSVLSNLNAINQPIEGEVVNGLMFNYGQQQTQMCNSQGQGSWKFSVSPTVKHGNYYLVILTDWNGQTSNWSWWPFNVQKAG